MERKIRKAVRIDARVTGAPGARLRLKSVSVIPSSVTIEGPESILSRTEIVKTEPILLSDIRGSVTLEKKLELPAHIRPVDGERVKVRLIMER